MNGRAFKNLPLEHFFVDKNECIDSSYYYSPYIHPNFTSADVEKSKQDLISEISKKCAFTERNFGKNQISCLKEECNGRQNNVCCSFDNSSAISSTDFSISDRRHDGVTDMNLNQNPKIEYLPILFFLKFSNIQTFNAESCKIREISKKNFEHLLKLQDLNLAFNRIESIKRDTFEGLLELKKISLSKSSAKMHHVGHLFTLKIKLYTFIKIYINVYKKYAPRSAL